MPRSRLLPAAVDILLAGGEVDEAGDLAAELVSIAESFGISGPDAPSRHA